MEPVLRLCTAGDVDAGKSTLIGRLLYDSKALYEDHLLALEQDAVKKRKNELDYSLLTDGLMAEREQGITIDVAYRYFSTSRRHFILADSPGHEQYTRNMATAASQSDVLLLFLSIDCPVSNQARRHSMIASCLGVKQFVVVVNKLDLVDHSESAFRKIQQEYEAFASHLNIEHLYFIPVSALKGDNVVNLSQHTVWYQGAPLLQYLETLVLPHPENSSWRFPIQCVLRPLSGGRFYAGTLEKGILRKKEEALCLPNGIKTRIQTILHQGQEIEEAVQGQALAIQFETEIEAGRGSVLTSLENPPFVSTKIGASLIWMDGENSSEKTSYLLMHTTQTVVSRIEKIEYVLDIQDLEKKEAPFLKMNEMGEVVLFLEKPIVADLYEENRSTGSFILIDPDTYRTVGAGLIRNLKPPKQGFRKGFVLWLTGLPASGKTTIARGLEKRFKEKGRFVYVLDGDVLRKGLNSDLGFSFEDRKENIRRVGEVAALFADAGCIVIVALISPVHDERDAARLKVPHGQFFEIYLNTPLACCEKRDPKGHYKQAREGIIPHFTGVSSSYEPPKCPALTLDTSVLSVEDCITQILDRLGF